jgi:hypothetical protein
MPPMSSAFTATRSASTCAAAAAPARGVSVGVIAAERTKIEIAHATTIANLPFNFLTTYPSTTSFCAGWNHNIAVRKEQAQRQLKGSALLNVDGGAKGG